MTIQITPAPSTAYLRSALVKVAKPTAEIIRLSPREARAVFEFLLHCGLPVDTLVESWPWQKRGEK